MALKQRFNLDASFSMASMTDIIFLLLLFFMLTSTIVVPSSIKVLLPKATEQAQPKPVISITIDKNLNYYISGNGNNEKLVSFDEITPFLQSAYSNDPDLFVALYADEVIQYSEIVKILNIAAKNNFKIVLMTRSK